MSRGPRAGAGGGPAARRGPRRADGGGAAGGDLALAPADARRADALRLEAGDAVVAEVTDPSTGAPGARYSGRASAP